MNELDKLSVSTLLWISHHGDTTLKKAVVKVLRKKGKGEYKKVR
jgi:hypothetical protein